MYIHIDRMRKIMKKVECTSITELKDCGYFDITDEISRRLTDLEGNLGMDDMEDDDDST